jgi:hypothetical protein
LAIPARSTSQHPLSSGTTSQCAWECADLPPSPLDFGSSGKRVPGQFAREAAKTRRRSLNALPEVSQAVAGGRLAPNVDGEVGRVKFSPFALRTSNFVTVSCLLPLFSSFFFFASSRLRVKNIGGTRLPDGPGFPKKPENPVPPISLHFMYCNFVRIHQGFRVSPAMEARITDRLWTLKGTAKLAG